MKKFEKIDKVTYKELSNYGLVGLANLGNTCFLNSALQCLSSTLPLTRHILLNKFINRTNKDNSEIIKEMTKKKEFPMFLEYMRLIRILWCMGNGNDGDRDERKKTPVYRPINILKTLVKFNNRYTGFRQHDSHEILMMIINLLHTVLASERTISISGTPKTEIDKLTVLSMEQWKREFEKEYSVLTDMFWGQFRSITICNMPDCDHESNVFDSFSNITLPIADEAKTIYDCFEDFTLQETLSDGNKWKCEKCKKESNASRQMVLWKLPEILIVNFKRFVPTGKGWAKNGTKIDFPIDNLDLSKWTESYDNDSSRYELYAINNHSGGLNGGHCYAYCKNPNGDWYMLNDTSVSKISKDQLVTNNAYVLFYRKIDD